MSQIHIAETKEQAYRDVEYGLADYFAHFREVAALPVVPEGPPDHLADQVNDTGMGVVGTPDDLIVFIEHLVEQSAGGFGTFLVQAHEWGDPAATRRSYELLAQHVMPHFQGSARRPEESKSWVMSRRPELMAATGGADMSAIQAHVDEKAATSAEPGDADAPAEPATTA